MCTTILLGHMKKLVFHDSRRVEVQNLLQPLSDGESCFTVRVVTIPNGYDVLILAARHSYSDQFRRPKILSNNIKKQFFPQYVDEIVLMAYLDDPATTIWEGFPCGLQISSKHIHRVPVVLCELGRVLQVRVVPPKSFHGTECPDVNQIIKILLYTVILSIRGCTTLGLVTHVMNSPWRL